MHHLAIVSHDKAQRTDTALSTVSFFTPASAEDELPLTVQSAEPAAQQLSEKVVSDRRTTEHMDTHTGLSDYEREAEIKGEGLCIELCLKLGWKADAEAAKQRMYALINGRSRNAVLADEIRKGLI